MPNYRPIAVDAFIRAREQPRDRWAEEHKRHQEAQDPNAAFRPRDRIKAIRRSWRKLAAD
jgi:hypothetical protein